MNYSKVVSDEPVAEKDEQKITLFDIGGTLRFSVRRSNLYYIESDDNYIKGGYEIGDDKRNRGIQQGLHKQACPREIFRHFPDDDRKKHVNEGNDYNLEEAPQQILPNLDFKHILGLVHYGAAQDQKDYGKNNKCYSI